MKYILNIVFITFLLNAFGQNLVPNGSFEEYNLCPDDYSIHNYTPYVSGWECPNQSTPDYFNACSYKCGVPLNWVGNAKAFHGKAYMGIIGCMQQIDRNQIAYREYIRIQLKDSLLKGKKYYASMQVRLGLSCTICCNGMGMVFSPTQLNSSLKTNYPIEPTIIYSGNQIIDNKGGWTKVCGTFEATGGERFLIIGNFLSNQQITYQLFNENLIATREINPSAYYFIDDVKVVAYCDSLTHYCEAIQKTPTAVFNGELDVKTKMVLNNLYFENDKSVILKESYFELDKLAYELRRKPNINIAIYGHTDSSGTIEHNQKLSEKRAIAVRNYLLEKGVSRFRITTQGFGDTMPIAGNYTEEGKKLNRRVEIKAH